MEGLIKVSIILISFLTVENSFARSLIGATNKLGTEAYKIGTNVAVFGVVLGAIYFIIGKQDAGTKMTQISIGVGILYGYKAIISFISGIA